MRKILERGNEDVLVDYIKRLKLKGNIFPVAQERADSFQILFVSRYSSAQAKKTLIATQDARNVLPLSSIHFFVYQPETLPCEINNSRTTAS